MVSISRAVANVKNYLSCYVPDTLILQACKDVDHAWRERLLGPVATTYLFLQQVLHGNTACSHLRHLSGRAVNASRWEPSLKKKQQRL